MRVRQRWQRVRNYTRLRTLRGQRNLRVHLGCGDDRLSGFVNLDVRFTRSADIVTDLIVPHCFGAGAVDVAFSNAFFEHLYRDRRRAHLEAMVNALSAGGVCCYIGLPYFKTVAKLYLEGGPGVIGERFDLYNVYRYTHGDPESVGGWWLEQLHKSLFDEHELSDLLQGAGFGGAVLFSYCYPGEEGRPVNIGFYASKDARDPERLRSECRQFLAGHAAAKVLLATLEFIP